MQLNALGYLIGSGSMTLGVEAAGFRVNEVWETPGYSKNAETWDLNRPNQRHRVLSLDHTITDAFVRDWGHYDLIYGNPPCGGVSAMTCSRIESPTNTCMRQWIRMVAPARPRMILMENGYQLATDRLAPLLGDLTGVLDHYGYYWWTWMMYSYQVGCPQIRRRMFLCATLEEPKNRKLLHTDDLPIQGKKSAPSWPWLWDLADVEPSEHPVTTATGAVVTQHWYYDYHSININQIIAAFPDRVRSDYLTTKDWNGAAHKSEYWKKKHQHRYWPDCPREIGGMCMHRLNATNPDEAIHTILGYYKYIHPTKNRLLTMREMARLMGYPDHWQFHELRPALIAQGIPAQNAYWASDRMLKVLGER